TVHGLEEAALLVGPVEATQGADVNNIGIFGMDSDAADLERLLEPHVLPSLAAVGGLVNSISIGDGVTRVRFAGADPNDIAIRGRHAHISDGDGRFVVEL